MKEALVYGKDIEGVCNYKVEVISTGYCGGDAGHGGITRVSFTNLDTDDRQVLRFDGDCELDTLIEALDFVSKKLKHITKVTK